MIPLMLIPKPVLLLMGSKNLIMLLKEKALETNPYYKTTMIYP